MDLEAFQCRCGECPRRTPDVALSILVRNIEEHFQRPVLVHSGHRCAAHNTKVGGSPNSLHRQAMAVDISIPGVPLQEIYDWVDRSHKYCGLGIYNSHVHVDSRDKPARWDYRNGA